MTIDDYSSIEFGIGFENGGVISFAKVPIDDSVRWVLVEMLDNFNAAYLEMDGEPSLFEASEKYGPNEKLTIGLQNEGLETLRALRNEENIIVQNFDLGEIANSITFYFAIFRLNDGTKIVTVKRPAQFKGLLKVKNRLVRLVDDTLKAVPDNIFKLDTDFDFVIRENDVDILHPTGFTFLADIDDEIFRAAVSNTVRLMERIPFINFVAFSEFVGHSKTAAKLIASIKNRQDIHLTSIEKLQNRCAALNIVVRNEGDLLTPEDGHVIGFLQLLDRRQYDVDLVDGEVEIYLAASRKKI